MSNKRKNRKTKRGSKGGILSRAFNQTKLAANVTEEQDWYLDTPDVRLTRVFAVVLILHVVAVGGILAFKMIDKASVDNGVQLSAASKAPEAALEQQSTVAGQIPQKQDGAADESAKAKIAAPLRQDQSKDNQYRVLAGDTLSEIAKSLGVDPAALRAKNAIQSDRELYPGRWLDVPEKDAAAVKRDNADALPKPQVDASQVRSNSSVGSTAVKVYRVQKGDTVWALSRKFSVSYQDLISVNSIENPQNLRIGQELNIPTAR